MSENDVSYAVRGAAFKVHTALGPGLLESVYEAAMAHELRKNGLLVATQVGLPAYYDSVKLEVGFRLDLLVEDKVIVEIKSVDALLDVHHKQLLTYLRLSKRKLGLLINFNTPHVKDGIIRIANTL
ncbi:GxxExxY protein [Microvirga sp. STR05]|uniref:GxxExxY protein n=1 Tax=Hymenobacter duratus TaxID=2771356 RepID=A0ABR8JDL1_9BACT|nr:GxxExxY protein [Hymenobacter duratus]MBD2714934.1 GxxExxY protein [Hymenobacter duratus]MBR7949840.1 GxxExxY protein [Microvirga sp. STR05]